MSPSAKTIQIFLPSGDPQGIRIAEITTRIVQVIEVPRALLKDFLVMPESGQVAVYFLFGGTGGDEDTEPKVYVGQTGDLRSRLAMHNRDREKDFWQRALVLVSRTNSLTQTHALFLEWHCLQEARRAARYADANGNAGTRPHTTPPMNAECLEIFETGQILLATLGYPLFDPVAKATSAITTEETFVCKAAGTNARMQYTPEGFVVLKGSVGRRQNVRSIIGTSSERLRNRLVESGVMREEGETVIFERDHLFNSPSIAAMAVTGRNCNGWLDWKTKDGKTLDEVKRQ